MPQSGYDVHYGSCCGPSIEPHFCREWDESGGCYGGNPNHGYTKAQAIKQIIEWHEQQIAHWKSELSKEAEHGQG